MDGTTRRGFLGQVGRTLLVGAGVAAAIPVLGQNSAAAERQSTQGQPNAPLVSYRCCANANACPSGCGTGTVRFYCTSSQCPGGAYCTGCQRVNRDCYYVTQPACI